MNTLLDLLRQPATPRPASPDGSTTPDCFWAEGRLPAGHLAIEVEGLGLLPQPLPPAQAQALHDLSEPAQFGLRDQTLLDTTVRHTGEISADLLSLDWQPGAFAALKQAVAQALGVEQIDAWLHNLLIYGPGQFFKPHQDTEKHPGMVATLVLVWPSPHIGGTLRVQLGQQEAALSSQHLQAQDLRWFAFYADCRHEVLPVQEGWRVALTFDLVLPAQVARPAVPARLQTALEHALRQQFAMDGDTPGMAPWVLLLDHEYTEHGLRWPLLKGDDRWRVAALRAAAEALGLRLHLALAELHQTWSAEPAPRSRWSRHGDEADPQRGELIDESLSLDFWVDEHDQVGPRSSLSVRLDDTASFTETGSAHLVDEQYEGYMGNYGDTLDYWYRRAALVIQSPLAVERDRFALDFDGALAELQRLAGLPAESVTLASRVKVAARTLAYQVSVRGRTLLDAYAEIAAALPDPEAATALLADFDPSGFLPEDAATLARLQHARGTLWLRTVLQRWNDPQARRFAAVTGWRVQWGSHLSLSALWPTPLPAFTQAALDAGWSLVLLDDWFDACLAALKRFDQARVQAKPANRMQLQPAMLQAVDELAQSLVLRADDGIEDLRVLIDHVLAHPGLYPATQLAPFVQSVGALSRQWPQDRLLHDRVTEALRNALNEPLRDLTDHRLCGVEWVCRCKDCMAMIPWAESASAEPLVLAMAEPRRQHVQSQFEAAGAPLTATTLRQGSPHKLVLRKPGDLQARDRAAREAWRRDLAMLGD
ncbi:hypothetical protein ABIC99_003185 [Sphaerotilus sulfidivorans]|uniref:2OG-Fe(II) oxygenase n=1 Tax=Sphaerotilus sulfidivorans TaxID=639200 RepID=A0A5C1Q6A5_9BURK|nr:2OG-Fe(II) oxygenase [Sphaerotilus sulfidivorans]NZD47167.1 2OG-Fe(II) oxygenase [Sphaerotilus sulfidivorans]QEN02459.1 2OG-Fe(II) oxygenase [Sphaerotilus sulfidivorans]